MDALREGKAGINGESSAGGYALPCVRERAGGRLQTAQGAQGALRCPEGGMGVGRGEFPEGRHICLCIADSLHCTAETNNIVKQLYLPPPKSYLANDIKLQTTVVCTPLISKSKHACGESRCHVSSPCPGVPFNWQRKTQGAAS